MQQVAMTLSLPPAGALRTSIRVGGYGIAAGPVGAAAALRHEQGTTRRAGPRRWLSRAGPGPGRVRPGASPYLSAPATTPPGPGAAPLPQRPHM